MQNQKWPIIIQLHGDNELIPIADTEQLQPDKTLRRMHMTPQINSLIITAVFTASASHLHSL
jgi:hypothetical protein